MTLVVCKPFSDCASCFVAKIWAVKVVVKLRSRWKTSKMGSFAPRFLGEGMPQSLAMHFQIALTSEHVAGSGWVSFGRSARRLAAKKRKKADRIAVKRMSVDDYVGQPNELLTCGKSALGLPRSMSWKRPVVDVRTSLVQCSDICCCCSAAEWRHHSDDWSAASPMT